MIGSLHDELRMLEAACYSARDPHDVFDAVDASLQRVAGHRLLTILVYNDAFTIATRLYSSEPATYLVGVSDPVASNEWADVVLHHGLPYVGHREDDLATVFEHHERLALLGLGSVINMPIRWRGRVLGTLNMLDAQGCYAHLDIDVVKIIAHMTLPALLAG